MKKIYVFLIVSAFLMTMFAAPLLAAGGKHHDEMGKGSVHQGDIGDAGDPGTSGAPGDNAQGHQAD